MVNNYKYDEWGNIQDSKETIRNPFKYAGEVYDEETGLYYLRAINYDPSTGRFINEDTYEGQLNNPLSLNQYSYCFNNPLLYVDPDGHDDLTYEGYTLNSSTEKPRGFVLYSGNALLTSQRDKYGDLIQNVTALGTCF